MENSGIYKITNIKTNKFYIGSSKHLNERWQEHKEMLRNNKHINPKLQNSWNYHGGESAFVFEILENADPEKILEREQFYLDTLKPYEVGYNIGKSVSGGDNITNHPEREKFIEKMRVINSTGHMHGRKHRPDTIKFQQERAKGRHTLEWFVAKHGQEEGSKLYHARRENLKNRNINYSHDNKQTGKLRGTMPVEIREKISKSKSDFKLKKKEFIQDVEFEQFTIQQLATKYSISPMTVKYHKRKLKSNKKL
jgi:group I intron endonuclease